MGDTSIWYTDEVMPDTKSSGYTHWMIIFMTIHDYHMGINGEIDMTFLGDDIPPRGYGRGIFNAIALMNVYYNRPQAGMTPEEAEEKAHSVVYQADDNMLKQRKRKEFSGKLQDILYTVLDKGLRTRGYHLYIKSVKMMGGHEIQFIMDYRLTQVHIPVEFQDVLDI